MKSMIALLVLLSSLTAFALETGKPAPDFTLPGTGTKGGDIKLSDYKGKIVVLEWINHGCPFVRKHYDSGNMQALQKEFVSKNVIWFSVNSTANREQGPVTTDEARSEMAKNNSGATNTLIDTTGAVGKLYGAKTTPHMYIIDKAGNLAYQGAIDDKADADKASVPGAKNYVREALNQLIDGRPVTQHTTKSYGCSVKYKD